jgi:hypothetical protein
MRVIRVNIVIWVETVIWVIQDILAVNLLSELFSPEPNGFEDVAVPGFIWVF